MAGFHPSQRCCNAGKLARANAYKKFEKQYIMRLK
jgi:hypothetical protein